MKKRFDSKRTALLAILCACALIMFAVENLIPSIGVPGAKLGLGNVFSLLAIILLGGAEGIVVVVVKSVLGCLIVGNTGALIYSLSAGLASVAFSVVMLGGRNKGFTLVAISVSAAVINNIVQTAVFCLVTQSDAALGLLPYLALIGAVGGAAVGITVMLIVKKVPMSVWKRAMVNEEYK